MSALEDRFRRIAERVRIFWRATHGQDLDSEQYQYLLDLDDIRERTILMEHDAFGHSIMRLGAAKYEELRMWGKIADMEDHYCNSIEGESKRIAATIAVGRRETTQAGVSINLPTLQTRPEEAQQQPQQKQEKKGLFHR